MKILILFLITLSLHASTEMIGGVSVPANSPILSSTVSLVAKYNGALSSFCSGSVIAPSVVVTAAHCLDAYTSGPFYVAQGPVALEGKMYSVKAAKFYSKGFYKDVRVDDLEKRDVALLLLEDNVPLTPLRIAHPDSLLESTKLIQAGYGHTKPECDDGSCGMEDLGVIQMLTSGKFAEKITPAIYVRETKNHRVGTGDSGGPLLIEENGELLLHGVLSEGMESDEVVAPISRNPDDFFSIYTHPYYFFNWINCSIEDDLRMDSRGPLSDQVPCDDVPMMRPGQLKTFKKNLCEALPGFKFLKNDCWPVTKEACEKFSGEVEPELIWNDETQQCEEASRKI